MDKYLYDSRGQNINYTDYTSPKSMVSMIAKNPAYKFWNATLLVNLLATGVIDVENVENFNAEGATLEAFGFTPFYANRVKDIYTRLLLIEEKSVPEVTMHLAALRDDVKQYDPLAKSVLQNVGEITFGRPTVFTEEEKSLDIPDSIRRDFDVYWIDLAVTFREMSSDDVAEMGINFATPEGTVALELIPLVYSNEFAVGKEVGSPEIGVKLGGATVTLGEVYRKTIAYTQLKPTVVAYGLGERRFSWTISEEAIRVGSHRFVAIVGVPKGSEGVEIAMSGHVRLRKGFLGGIFGDEGIAGTESKLVPISFSDR